MYYGGQVGPERRDYGGESVALADVAGHQVHLCARLLEIVLQLQRTWRLFTTPTEEYKPPNSMPANQVPGQHRPQGPGTTGDENRAPADGAVGRRTGRGRQSRDAQHALTDGDLGLPGGEGGGHLS